MKVKAALVIERLGIETDGDQVAVLLVEAELDRLGDVRVALHAREHALQLGIAGGRRRTLTLHVTEPFLRERHAGSLGQKHLILGGERLQPPGGELLGLDAR